MARIEVVNVPYGDVTGGGFNDLVGAASMHCSVI